MRKEVLVVFFAFLLVDGHASNLSRLVWVPDGECDLSAVPASHMDVVRVASRLNEALLKVPALAELKTRLTDRLQSVRTQALAQTEAVVDAEPATPSSKGTCRFGMYSSASLATSSGTLTTTNGDGSSLDTCAASCEANAQCFAFQFQGSTCTLVTDFVQNMELTSAVCAHRGGCDNQGADTVCAWVELDTLELANVITSGTPKETLSNLPLEACRTACDSDMGCVAFSHTAANGACSLFDTFVGSDADSTVGVCARGIAFEAVPSRCFFQDNCSGVKVRVPSTMGDSVVSLKTSFLSPNGTTLHNNVMRSSDGVAAFDSLQFSGDGDYELVASSPDVQCPVVSPRFSVYDKNDRALWFWQRGFKTDEGFTLVRPARDCKRLLALLVVVSLASLVVFMQLLTNFYRVRRTVANIAVGVVAAGFQSDMLKGWYLHGCGVKFNKELDV